MWFLLGTIGDRGAHRSPRNAWRPLLRMCATSIIMQPASAKRERLHRRGAGGAGAVEGERVRWPLGPRNRGRDDQIRSTTVGGFATARSCISRASVATWATTCARAPSAASRRASLVADAESAERQPAQRQHDEQIRQVLAVAAVRAVRLGRPVQRFAVGEDVGFGQLVEAVDQELHDEDEQEDCGHLEEQPEVDAVAVARPQPGDEGGASVPISGAGDDARSASAGTAACPSAAPSPSPRG